MWDGAWWELGIIIVVGWLHIVVPVCVLIFMPFVLYLLVPPNLGLTT